MPVERPQLRSHLRRVDVHDDPDHVYLVDRLALARPLALTHAEFAWLDYLDGDRTLTDIQLEVMRRHGANANLDHVKQWIARLDDGLFLDTTRFRSIVDAAERPPSCLGCYEPDANALRRQIRDLFVRGAGVPKLGKPDGSLHAVLIPHIDYARGGLSYTYPFKELFEKSDASLFVIIGTSHHSTHRFTLTRKNFRTPLGVVPTDQAFVDRLERSVGRTLFADEWLAHFPEHSIELEVIFLQYLYEKVRPIRIVPLVVGSFHDCVLHRQSPLRCDDIATMVKALRAAEAHANEPVCTIISGDLAHIGPKFDARQTLDAATLEHSYRQDAALLRALASLSMTDYFDVIASELDERNICGLPPTFAALEAIQARRSKVLCYDRYIHPQGHESVSFAGAAFYR